MEQHFIRSFVFEKIKFEKFLSTSKSFRLDTNALSTTDYLTRENEKLME